MSVLFSDRWQVLIAITVGIALAIQYGVCTQDDAFISFRYAENLVNGHGLVFNPGERVEGFSNPSWTLLFAILIGLGFNPVSSSVFLGYCSIAFLVYSTTRLSKVVGGTVAIAAWAVVLDPSMLLEAVEGLESVFYAGLITLSCAWMLQERQENRSHLPSTLLFILASFTRPEAPIFFIIMHVSASYYDRRYSRSIETTIPFISFLLLCAFVRLIYYGDILPNTFYAKVGGLAIERGISYCHLHIKHHPLMWLGLMFVFTSNTNKREWFVLTFLCLGYLAYVITIGGDFKPTSRFILPLTGIMAASISMLNEKLNEFKQDWIWLILAVIVFFGRMPLYAKSLQWAENRRMNLIARKVVGDWIAIYTPPDTVIAMHSVGVIPYYAGRYTIDMWGLNDRTIAKSPAPKFGKGLAGHEKTNPEYVFSRNPDIYLPEDQFFLPKRIKQKPEDNFPPNFSKQYTAVSIPIEASWLNIWMRNDFGLIRIPE
jgi:arabinofuranosyltransferase